MSQEEDKLERTKGDWSRHDKKKYIGKIDRVNVSLSESWEVEYFVDHWLETRGRAVTNANRDRVAEALEKFVGRAPYKRDDLNAYLDSYFKLSPNSGQK